MILYPILAAAISLTLTGSVRRFALRRALLDHPNHRSLHDSPTPRGGGIGLVAPVLAYVTYALLTGVIDRSLGIALVGGGASLLGAIYPQRSQDRLQRVASELWRTEAFRLAVVGPFRSEARFSKLLAA